MIYGEQPEGNQVPEPIKHSDADRVTGEEAQSEPGSEGGQGEESANEQADDTEE